MTRRATPWLRHALALALCAGAAADAYADEPQSPSLPALESAAQAEPGAVTAPSDDVVPASPRAILERALDNRYRLDARASIEITITTRNGATDVKKAEVVSKFIGGELHSIGRFTFPEDVRDMTVLRIGNPERDDEYFVYLPEFRRVRRVSDPPKADMFFGSDANYEDVEERTTDDYTVEQGPTVQVDGEEAYLVRGRPTYGSGYERVDYVIAKTDAHILEQRFYKRGADEPYKLMKAPREHTQTLGGHVIPMAASLTDHEHGTYTEMRVVGIEVNPEIPDRLFTLKTLTQEARLPRLK